VDPGNQDQTTSNALQKEKALKQANILEKNAESSKDPLIQNELIAASSRQKSIAAEQPSQESLLIPRGIKDGLLGWWASFFEESKNKLPKQMAQVAITEQMGDIIQDSKKAAETVRKVNDTYIYRINEILKNIFNRNVIPRSYDSKIPLNNGITPEEANEIDDLLKKLEVSGIKLQGILIDPSQTAMGQVTGNVVELRGSHQNGMGIRSSSNKTSAQPHGKKGSAPTTSTQPDSKKGSAQPDSKKGSAPTTSAQPDDKKGSAPLDATTTSAQPDGKEIVPPIAPTTSTIAPSDLSSTLPEAPQVAQAAGGKTRKTRQYIHDIKKNRTELFNKEMEIITSIRNFKHGHNDDSKKRFIKAVKTS
jgi:hypothetical protein